MSVDITPGSGKTVAADVIGTPSAPATGQQLQYVKLDLGIAGSSNPASGLLPVGGNGGGGSSTFNRPANTTAYAANATVSNGTSVLTFSGIARINGGTGYIVKARLTTSQTTIGNIRFRLHLFRVAPTAINDGTGCTAPLAANLADWIGYIDFQAMQIGGGSPDRAYSFTDQRLHFKAASSDTALYGLLQVLDAYTPSSAASFECYLSSELD